jgi:predicted PurR-regulated permease PerM
MNWNNKLNKRFTLISMYVIVTCIIIYCLSLLAKNAPAILAVIMDKLKWVAKVAKPIVLAFVLAYIFDPLNDFFELQFKKIKIRKKQIKAPRTWAVFTTVFLLFAAVAAIITILVFSVTKQIRVVNLDDVIILMNSYMKSINDLSNSVLAKLNELNIQSEEVSNYVKGATTYLLNSIRNVAGAAVTSISNISSYLTTFLFSFIIGIYFMIDGAMIKEFIKKVGRALLNDKWNSKISGFLKDADSVFSGYIRGQLSDALVMMILISLTLSVIGVKFAILIGIFAGIGNLIPYCGPFIAYFSTIVVCIINGQYKELLVAIITLFIVQAVDGNIIAPRLLSRSIQIHPVLVIISLIFGNAVGGLLGMLLAVPVGALVKLIFVRYIDHQLKKKDVGSPEQVKEIIVPKKKG